LTFCEVPLEWGEWRPGFRTQGRDFVAVNDVVLLRTKLERHREEIAPGLTLSEHQTFFVASHYLSDYNMSHQDLLAGVVDGTHDCGLDAIYVFANGVYLKDDISIRALGRNVRLDLVLLQVKDTTGFKEDAINTLQSTLPKLLDSQRDERMLTQFANERVIEATRRFLAAYSDMELIQLSVYVAFASLRANDVHPYVAERSEKDLRATFDGIFSDCHTSVSFFMASGILDMARESPTAVRELQLAEIPLSTDRSGAFIGVVKLSDYDRFITSEDGGLEASLFEANVRDYEGDVSVNASIRATLARQEDDVDFWWLNNGVTIVATSVQQFGKGLKLENPQIVNGLQTSNEIFKRPRSAADASDTRSILVKVIAAKDAIVRDRIIRATNSQTNLGLSALKATDRTQRQIEEYLATRGMFYERRRRFYFNQQKPIDKIISIEEMGQAVLSVLVQAPHVARGEVGRVFEDDNYDMLFHAGHPLPMYASALGILRGCNAFLLKESYSRASAEDFQFQLASLVGMLMTRKHRPKAKEIADLEDSPVPDGILRASLKMIMDVYDRESRLSGVVILDRLAKDPKVTEKILARGRGYLGTTSPPGAPRSGRTT